MTKRGRWLAWAGLTLVLSLGISAGAEPGKATVAFIFAAAAIGAVLWLLFVRDGKS